MKITSDKSNSYRNMDDVEHVLRFFTIQEGWDGGIKETLSIEMDKFMQLHRHDETNNLINMFNKSINGCRAIWGNNSFQKPNRDQMISPLYDAQMVAISLLNEEQINTLSQRSDQVIARTAQLIDDDPEFYKSISQSTNNANSIRKRVSSIRDMLLDVL
jgi:hypothetical protein